MSRYDDDDPDTDYRGPEPPDYPYLIETFHPSTDPELACELIEDSGILVLNVRRGGVMLAVPLNGFADVLMGPLLKQLERDVIQDVPTVTRTFTLVERVVVAAEVLRPVLERPTDEGDGDPDPF